MTTITLSERKKARAQEMHAGLARLRNDLAKYGRAQGGRFWVYGSAAADALRYDSDIDILTDFDADRTAAAIRFAEATCVRHGLKPDVRAKSSCTLAFLDRISPRALMLP